MFDIDPHSYASPPNNSMCWVIKVKASVSLISFDSSKMVTTALLMTHHDLRVLYSIFKHVCSVL